MADRACPSVRATAFHLLRQGRRPLAPADLIRGLRSAAEIREEFDALVTCGALEVDEHGAIVGAHGLTLSETPHRVVLDGDEVHTWCAYDAIGIPAALGVDAEIGTRCGWCGRLISLSVVQGEPPGNLALVLWFPTDECGNVREVFCPLANLFCDDDHLDSWRQSADDPVGRRLNLAEARDMGRSSWADIVPGFTP